MLSPRSAMEGGTDLNAWSQSQAHALRSRDWHALDVDVLAEILDEMSSKLQSELRSRSATLMSHVLKRLFQPERASRSWQKTIEREAEKLVDLVVDNPSLRHTLPELLTRAYRNARATAARETTLPIDRFPTAVETVSERFVEALRDAEVRLQTPPAERWVESTFRS